MTRLRFILCMLWCWAIHLQAQVTLSGVVTDSSNGEAVEFATVTLHPGEQWCMTDREGAFTIKANSLAKTMLRVTCVGYEPVEVSLTRHVALVDAPVVAAARAGHRHRPAQE